MSTPAYVDSETATHADGAQSSRLPFPLPDDPYVAVRQTPLVDIESEPEEAPSEAEELTDSSHSSASSDSTTPLSPDHPLTHTSPTFTPTRASFHHRMARMTVRVWSQILREREGSKDEGPDFEEEEEAAPKGQQQ
ncbi:hypothetical protein Tco_0816140 [Tanacetum coccineum]